MRSHSTAGAIAATSAPANQTRSSLLRALWGASRRGRSADGQASMLRRQPPPPGSSPREPSSGVLRSVQTSSSQQTRALSNMLSRPSSSGQGTCVSLSLRSTMRVAAGLWQGRKTGGGMFRRGEGRVSHLDLLRLASPLICFEAVGRRHGHAGVPHAMLDKSSGSPPPGAGGEKGKPPQKTTAIPATSSNATSAGQAQTADSIPSLGGDGSARAALERLFAQAQLYEQRVGDPDFATEEELEAVVRQLEADLGQVLGMLRTKEEELTRAERKLEEEREEVEEAHAVLVQREGQLEVVKGEQVGRQEDLELAKAALRQQRQETERVTAELRVREREVVAQREDVKQKARQAQMANVQLAEQKGALLELEALLVKKQRELGEALEEREAQRRELTALQGVLARQREEHKVLRTDLESKRRRLESVEKDLSIRTKAFSAARSEIQTLRTQLQGLTTDSRSSSLELQRAQALLSEVQDELRASHSAVLQFQADVAEEEANGLRLEAEISRLSGALLLRSQFEDGQASELFRRCLHGTSCRGDPLPSAPPNPHSPIAPQGIIRREHGLSSSTAEVSTSYDSSTAAAAAAAAAMMVVGGGRMRAVGGVDFNVKAVTVDAAGTLLEPTEAVADVYLRLGERYGVELSTHEILSRYRRAFAAPFYHTRLRYEGDGREYWSHVATESTGCSHPGFLQDLHEYYSDKEAWRLTDENAGTAFEAMRKAGLKLAVVSNFDNRLGSILHQLNCLEWFDALAVSAEVEAEKPNPVIFWHACEKLGVRPEQAVHVGDDRRNDVWGARDAGCHSLLWGDDVSSFHEVADFVGVRVNASV